MSVSPNEDHWELRRFSCGLLQHICKKYCHIYQTLLPRATKTLLRCLLDPHKTTGSIYGALKGVVDLSGPEGVELLVVPNVLALNAIISSRSSEPDTPKLHALLLEVLKDFIHNRLQVSIEEASSKNAQERQKIVDELKNRYADRFGSCSSDIFSTIA